MKQRQTAGHWTEKQRNRGRMECTLAIKMRIEVLKRKPNPTRLLDYLTFLTLTLNSIDDLKIKFFPFTTKPRDAAQKSQKLVNLEMSNLNHTGWGGTRLRSQRSNSSYKELPSIALLLLGHSDRGTESFRTSFSQCFARAFLGTYTGSPQTVSLVTLHRCGMCLETLTDTATLDQNLSLHSICSRSIPGNVPVRRGHLSN